MLDSDVLSRGGDRTSWNPAPCVPYCVDTSGSLIARKVVIQHYYVHMRKVVRMKENAEKGQLRVNSRASSHSLRWCPVVPPLTTCWTL